MKIIIVIIGCIFLFYLTRKPKNKGFNMVDVFKTLTRRKKK